MIISQADLPVSGKSISVQTALITGYVDPVT